VRLSNADWRQLTIFVDGTGQTSDYRGALTTPAPAAGSELVLGNLLRHLPELAEDLPYAKWPDPYVVHAASVYLRVQTGPPPSATATVTLRHAHHTPTRELILSHERSGGVLRRYTRARDVFDVLEYTITAERLDDIRAPQMRLDIFGELYHDFGRERAPLAELPTYFAALFILSDVVRYQGQWKRLLDDHPDEAVLIDRLLDIAIRKVPNLVLNDLGGAVHLFKAGR
jgi:hypothetical protein